MVHLPRNRVGLAACLLAVVLAPSVAAAAPGLTIGDGASLDLGDGVVDLGCGDLDTDGELELGQGGVVGARHVTIAATGSLDGGSGTLRLAGDWTNAGSFEPDSGVVVFQDGCGVTTATLYGDNTFERLSLASTTGKRFEFEAGTTQTILDHPEILGDSAARLLLRSTVPGMEAFTDLQGSYTGDWIDVQDNHAIGVPIVLLAGSVSSGNSTGWTILPPPAGVPTLSIPVALALGMLLAAGALRRRRC